MSATLAAPITFRRALNDNISGFLCDLVPRRLDGTDRFLDIVTWNIRYFNHRDPERLELFTRILQEVNADVFVFQEVEQGALDEVASNLARSGAGLYEPEYGSTGGRNRMAFLIDTEWVRNTTEISELFAGEGISMPATGRVVFPRLPLAGEFVVRSEGGSFNFDLVGVHLKSSRASAQGGDGTERRTIAARRLADWLTHQTNGEDVVVTGDWNAQSTEPEWEPIRALQRAGGVHLGVWNSKDELSHVLQRRSRRVDAVVVSSSGGDRPVVHDEDGHRATLLGWREEMVAGTLVRKMQEKVSSDMPVLCRLIFPKSA